MTTIKCSDCDKKFKTQTGLVWHLGRTHQSKPEMVEDDVDASTDEMEVEVNPLYTRVESLEERVDELSSLSESLSLLTDLRDQVLGIQQQCGDIDEALNRQVQEQQLSTQGMEHRLLEAQRLAGEGSKAQSNVLALANFLKEDVLPSMAAHPSKPMLAVYRDQEAIDRLPKCEYCGSLKKEGRRTCGKFQCLAKVIRIPSRQTSRASTT